MRRANGLGTVALEAIHSAGLLPRLMDLYAFRKLLGDDRRVHAWKLLGMTVGDGVQLAPRVRVRGPENISIGAGTMIGGDSLLDGWGRLSVGRNCIINDEVKLLTAGHDVASPNFEGIIEHVTIGDYVWLPHRIIVLPGVTIGSYAIIGSGAVVTSDVEDYSIVAGNPARKIGERPRNDFTYIPTRPI
jgi:putative colanic acid biosynthesis acetyltransferase WcaF